MIENIVILPTYYVMHFAHLLHVELCIISEYIIL